MGCNVILQLGVSVKFDYTFKFYFKSYKNKKHFTLKLNKYAHISERISRYTFIKAKSVSNKRNRGKQNTCLISNRLNTYILHFSR
jgi:hypothetical protein